MGRYRISTKNGIDSSSVSQPDTSSLMARYLDGDPDAVGTLDGWIAKAASPFRARLAWQWDDVLQAARMEALRLLRQGSYRGDSSLSTYLWRAVNHVCIDHLRRQKQAPTVGVEDLAETEPGDEPSPLGRVIRAESERFLLRVLESTPPECRRLWALILDGQSYGEMSRQLGTSEGALRVKVLRCRRKAVAVREELLHSRGSVRVAEADPPRLTS